MIPRVLIIDADEGAAQTTRALIQHLLAGASVVIERSVESARRYLRQHPIDALIIDPSPYDLAAARLIHWLKNKHLAVRVIVLSSLATSTLRKQLAGPEVDLYLEKHQPPALLVEGLQGTLVRLRNPPQE
jgi:DNA-binding NarL/FixJ family response regulator